MSNDNTPFQQGGGLIDGVPPKYRIWWNPLTWGRPAKPKLPFGVRWQRYLRETAVTHIILVLVGNTALAQLYFNSAGTIIPGAQWIPVVLGISSCFSTIAFSLFEVRQVRAVNDMASTGLEYSRWEWGKTYGVLAVITFYNLYALALFNFAIWPDQGHVRVITSLPSPGDIPMQDWIHALFYSAVLYGAGLIGERRRTAEEEVSQAQEHIQKRLMRNAIDEADGMIDGKGGTGRAMLTMIAVGGSKAQTFLLNFLNTMTGRVSPEDVIVHSDVKGVIVPGAGRKLLEAQGPVVEADPIPTNEQVKTANPTEEARKPIPFPNGPGNPEQEKGDVVPGSHEQEGKEGADDESSQDPGQIQGPDDERLRVFKLPVGWSLLEKRPLSHFQRTFGYPQSTFSEVFNRSRFANDFEVWSHGAKVLETWKILAMVVEGQLQATPKLLGEQAYGDEQASLEEDVAV